MVGYASRGENSCGLGRRMPSPLLTGIHMSGGAGPGLCVGLVPTLATDTGRVGIVGPGVGMGTGCDIFCGEGSGVGIRRGVVTGIGFNTLSSGGSVIPGALPPTPAPFMLGGAVAAVAAGVVLGGGEGRLLVVRL